MKVASVVETLNGSNNENYITPLRLSQMLSRYNKEVKAQNVFDGLSNSDISFNITHRCYVEVFFQDNNNRGNGYTKVHFDPSNSVEVHLHLVEGTSDGVSFVRRSKYILSNSGLNVDTSSVGLFRVEGSSVESRYDQNYIFISKVRVVYE